MTGQLYIGRRQLRREDDVMLTGEARYTDDMAPDGCTYMQVVRADVPHARLLGVDARDAESMPGVLGVFTASDLRAAGIGPIPSFSRTPPFRVIDRHGGELPDASQYPLAEEKVRYLGEPVAFVVAESRSAAQDAAEAVVMACEPLPAAIQYDDLRGTSSVPVWDDHTDNTSFEWDLGDAQAVDTALATAERLIHTTLNNNRVVIAFMEPRSALAEFDGERLTLTTGSQGAPGVQAQLLGIMGLEAKDLRVITPHTGGGFGARGGAYPEFVMALFAARRLGRAVKWTSTRSEAITADCQSRDHEFAVTLGLSGDGEFVGLRVHVDWRHGAYWTSRSPWVMTQYLPPTVGGVYDVGPLDLRLRGLFSNTTPQSAYRGVGRVEATYLLESTIDAAAVELGLDPAELRRRNLVAPEQMPWRAAGGATYHSGEFTTNLEQVLALSDWTTFAARREKANAAGLLRGIGLAMFIENDGGAVNEFASVRATASGEIEVLAGTQDFGMGHQTVFAQVTADVLGLSPEHVHVREGDTDLIPRGSGSHGSRSARVGGGAVYDGCVRWLERAIDVASQQLEAASEDIEFNGKTREFVVAGTDKSVTLAALVASGEDLQVDHEFVTTRPAYSNGAQVVEVEIDPETGVSRIVNHVIVMDAGVLLNPLIVDGQMHGGMAQGLGQAKLEDVAYDADSGQTLSGSFMDYTLPRADDLSNFVIAYNEVVESDNPLGVKGAGEGPTSGAPAAFMNAVRDAIRSGGGNAEQITMPATSEKVWRALNSGNS